MQYIQKMPPYSLCIIVIGFTDEAEAVGSEDAAISAIMAELIVISKLGLCKLTTLISHAAFSLCSYFTNS